MQGALPGDAELAPAEVVEEQMRALAAWETDEGAPARVFSLASPANRAVTGPLEAFKELVESESYHDLIDNAGYRVGSARQAEGVAVVLVTLIDHDGGLVGYRFYLSRQGPGRDGRWMTDAVVSLAVPPAAGAGPPEDRI